MNQVSAPLDPARMTALLRDRVLAITPEDIGYSSQDCAKVWGVMMELGHPQVVVSLVVLLDGSVSIYLSDGDGVIGCGLHPDVRQAAAKLLQVAAQLHGHCAPVALHPFPTETQVSFYLLTRQGVLGGVAARSALDDGVIELAELYYAGHAVIALVELLGAGVDLIDEIHLAEVAQHRRQQLAAPQVGSAGDAEPAIALKPRGRGCRILPYVGNAVRRSQH